MVCYTFAFKRASLLQPDPAFVEQLLEQYRMMDDLILSPQRGIFVAEDIEAMGTGGDYFFNTVIIQQLNILVGHHLEKEFVAGTPDRISGAHLLFAEDGISDTDLIEDSSKGHGDPLRPLVKAAGAAYPKQDVGAFSFCCQFGHGRYLHKNVFLANDFRD